MNLRPPRRRYIVNPRFQLRWACMLAAVGAACATLFAVPLHDSITAQNALLQRALADEDRLYAASEDITILLMNLPETRLETAEMAGAHFDRAYISHTASRQLSAEIMVRNERLQAMITALVPLIAVLLFGLGILITHSVAGPLYVIKQQLEAYGATRQIDERALRKGDEFIDVYGTLLRVLSPRKDSVPGP